MKTMQNSTQHMTLMNNMTFKLPTPSNLNSLWNIGSLLGLTLMTQILSGILLAIHYTPNTNITFHNIILFSHNINLGWFIRNLHMNLASLLMLMIFIHISRGLLFKSFMFKTTWYTGATLLIFMMMAAFLGYVLPWGQMSLWGATVITNLLSTIPIWGNTITIWLWGNFSISNPTLVRFYTFHFIIPIMLMIMSLMHMITLHNLGSSNPTNNNSNIDKINFQPFFMLKDNNFWMICMLIFLIVTLYTPYLINDTENMIMANPLTTPTHIQPEWYFLFAYAILRSIPNKLGGVLALMMSILMLMILPMYTNMNLNSKYNYTHKYKMSLLMLCFMTLTWLGSNLVEPPFTFLSQIFSTLYFTSFII